MARNWQGKLIGVAFNLIPLGSPTDAESKALDWAMNLALEVGWSKVVWKSDSKVAVKAVLSLSDPAGWDSQYNIVNIQQKLKDLG